MINNPIKDIKLLCILSMNDSMGRQCFTKGRIYKAKKNTELKGQYGCSSLHDDLTGEWGINKEILNKYFKIIMDCKICTERKCNSCPVDREKRC